MPGKRKSRNKSKKDGDRRKESSKKSSNDDRNWKRDNNKDRNNSALSLPSEKGIKSSSLRAQVPSHTDGTEIRNVERKQVHEKSVPGLQSQPYKKVNDTKYLEWETSDEEITNETSEDSTSQNATSGILNRLPLIEPPKHNWQLFQKSLRLYHEYTLFENETVNEEIPTSESSSSDSEHGYIERPSASKGKSKSSISKISRKRTQNYQLKKNKDIQPPNEYRSLSIFPGKLDITDEIPFIRSNIVEGKYANCEQYLDVQFRLFREDFIKPLRESIKEYKQMIQECKEQSVGNYEIADVKKRLKLCYMYENVKIIKPKLEIVGLVHTLEFKPLPESYIWNSRLQEGTLLCLSSDEFVNTFIFATVTNRDADEVKKGRVEVCFEERKHDILYDVDESTSYVMLEMRSAYFESYRHTLSVLKGFDASNFPLQKYLVKIEKAIDKPCYLDDNTLYDFSPIVIEENYSDKEILPLLKEIPIMDEEKWPSQKELGLDFTQYGVLKAALTKELCVIQGPPGTGKTFMGLKIVKMLLHNSRIWCPENIVCRSPILIVCYTNHALDQFLERILEFTDELVRVGGQGESEILKDFTLRELRFNSSYSDPVLSDRKKRLENIEKYIKNQISIYNFVMEAASHTILSPKILKNYMDEGHYRSLVSQHSNKLEILEKWLGLDKIPEGNFDQDIKYSTHKLDYSSESMDIEEICSWLRWEYHDDREQMSYGWNKCKDDKYKTTVKNIFCDVDMMHPKEATNVKDVWILGLSDRLRLYRCWIARFIAFVINEVKHLQEEFIDITKQLNETRWGKDVAIVQKAEVVGMTCTGAAKFRYLVEAIAPQIVIVEEAAEVLEPHLITSLTKSTKHLILIGDHQQLRPLPSVHELAVQCKFDVSLFERMVRNDVEYCTLVSQHRMRPEFAELLKGSIYDELSSHENVFHYENILGIEKNLFFFSHISGESKLDTTYCNLFEAKMVVRLTRYFLLQGYEPSQITVLATYGGQVKMIKDERRKILEENKSIPVEALNGVKVTTVDNYQGEENDIIIVSFVRSNYEGRIGFLKYPNRVCVALSRARKGFYCFGNFEFLASESDLWTKVVDKVKQHDAFGYSLTLICQNHLFKTDIEGSGDFKKVFDGGCATVCNAMMKCGHVCKRLCHFIDLEHKETVCEEQCTKQCENGHPCQKKCHEDCGKCTKLRFAQLPHCGHTVPVPCNVTDLSEYCCEERCDKMLPCGHTCTKLCNTPCKPCLKKIPKTLPCGHTFLTECYNQGTCTKPCRLKLPCGHFCSKKCGEPCEQKCKHDIAVKLPCGHIVTVPCEERSAKIRCQAPCGVMLPCNHKCPGNCERCHQGRRHVDCWLTCGKSLDGRMTCKLRCGHKNKCDANFPVKGIGTDIRRFPGHSVGEHTYSDNHIVNKWKTGYNEDE